MPTPQNGQIHSSNVYRIPHAIGKMKFSIKDFFIKCDQIHSEKLNGKLIFCAVSMIWNMKVEHWPEMDWKYNRFLYV